MSSATRIDNRNPGAWLAAFLLGLVILLGTCHGCTASQHARYGDDAIIASVSLGQECVAQPAVECPWTAGADAFKTCVAQRALPCGIEKIGALLAIGLEVAWEQIGVRLAAPPVRDTPYPHRVIACADAIDANAVAARCERRHPSMCVADAVGRCLELAAEGDLAAGEPGPEQPAPSEP